MKSFQANLIIILLVAAAAATGYFFVSPTGFGDQVLPWRLGLDLAGGSTLVYDVDLSKVNPSDYTSVLNGLHDVIARRINLYGVSEPNVTVAKNGNDYQLLVELPGVKNLSQAISQIGETPVLDFRTIGTSGATSTQTYVSTNLTGRYITSASLGFDNLGRPLVNFNLNSDGAKIFQDITAQNVGKPLCIFIDNAPVFPADPNGSCPIIQSEIVGGQAQISGSGITQSVAQTLVERFNAGALAAPIKLVNQRTVNASAAADSLKNILIAGLIGAGLVALFMLFAYGKYGIFADLALLAYILLSLSLFKLIPNFTLTLAGIAGFILSIGMAVDANILIFERMKEEFKKGASKAAAIEEGFRRAWPSIRDSNMSTIITSAILYFFTSEFVKGFALTLGLGVLVSMFSAIFITRTLLKVFIRNHA
ncbi:MAG TPA: protein translocase subunit SecD [Candidatus Tyrphobacter sp.]|nr:protein translocase subunit SecD [Candidatus Tyrphobacter sp.]